MGIRACSQFLGRFWTVSQEIGNAKLCRDVQHARRMVRGAQSLHNFQGGDITIRHARALHPKLSPREAEQTSHSTIRPRGYTPDIDASVTAVTGGQVMRSSTHPVGRGMGVGGGSG